MKSYLRELANEFGESTNSVRVELNRLTEAGILESETQGQMVIYQARRSHPLFPEIKSLVSKYTGLDKIVEQVISYLGDIKSAYLIGDYAKGIDSGTIELVLVGNVKQDYLANLIIRIKREISRDFKCLVKIEEEAKEFFENQYKDKVLLLWEREV